MRPAPPGNYPYGVQSLARWERAGVSYHRWDMTAGRTPQALRQRTRYATAGQIADIVLYLAGEESANLVGAVLLANGGRFTA